MKRYRPAKLVFLGVVAYIAWLIISFWVGYYSRILPS